VTSTPREVYPRVDDGELSDAHPNESQRHALKGFARSLRARFSSRELAYLASAVEVEANLAREAEGSGGW
jgi:hypothetical protein